MNRIKLNKTEWSWALYDVAFSSFAILSTAFLPILLKLAGKTEGLANSVTTAHWGYVQSISTLVVALAAPVLGAMADFKGKKKLLFNLFFVIAILSLASMILSNNYYVLLIVNFICAIGYSGTNIVYDAYLMDVTEDGKMNFLSSLGFGIGYAGRCLPYIIGILLYSIQPFGISEITAIKISIGITVLWWIVFTIPFFKNVRQVYGNDKKPKRLFASSFKNTFVTLKKIVRDKNIGLFLIAYFFYIDGVNTLISMSSDFAYDLGVSVTIMAVALLATQIIAAPSVLIFERLARRFTTKNIILVAILVFAAICGYAMFMKSAWQFWVMAVATGLVLGTVQALSRSYFGRMIPDKNKNNEYFGFYNVLSRYSSILGPLMIAVFTTLTGSSRYGVASIVVLFVVGFILLLFVRNIDKKATEEPPAATLSVEEP
jgi:Permeases of the major facilitator superfamily